MQLQESGENYLETILILETRLGSVRSIDIATELGFTKASISRAMKILKNSSYITIKEDGNIVLTESGRKKAVSVYERHKLITKYFIMTLGIDDNIAEKDACRIEHIISAETFNKIKEYVERSTLY